MPLNREQEISLAQAGTVALPTPYPTIGKLKFHDKSDANADEMIEVILEISPRRSFRWFVRLPDICVYVVDPTQDGFAADNWFVGEAAQRQVRSADSGVIFVKEESQVLACTEAGLTASESIQLLGHQCNPD